MRRAWNFFLSAAAAALLVLTAAGQEEIQFQWTLQIDNGYFSYRGTKTITAPQTNQGSHAVTLQVKNDLPTNVVFSSLNRPRECILSNLSTNSIRVGVTVSNTFVEVLRLGPGVSWPVPLGDDVALQLQSVISTNTATATAFED